MITYVCFITQTLAKCLCLPSSSSASMGPSNCLCMKYRSMNPKVILCLLGSFEFFFLLIVFKIKLFEKFFQEYHLCKTIWIQIRPDGMSILTHIQPI